MREIYGDRVVVIPYIMAGFDLAAYCAREYPKQAGRNNFRFFSPLPQAPV